MQKGFSPILIILLIVFSGIGGYYLWRIATPMITCPNGIIENGKCQKWVGPVTTPSIPSDNTKTNNSNENANWKTYTNSDLGFSFKYPASFIVQEQTTNSYTLELAKNVNAPGFSSLDYITAAIMDAKTPSEEAKLLIDSLKVGETKNIRPAESTEGFRQSNVFKRLVDKEIDGLSAQVFLRDGLLGGPEGSYEKRVYVTKNDYIYYIRGYMIGGEVTDALFDQILSTFKFTK